MRKTVVRLFSIGTSTVALAAAFGVGPANADTSCGTLSNGGRTGTVYVTKGDASCSTAQMTVQRALAGPTEDVSGTGRGRQFTDSSGTVWSLYYPGAAEPDQRMKVWNGGTEFAWG